MPPKKQGQAPSKKTVEKKKEKIIEVCIHGNHEAVCVFFE